MATEANIQVNVKLATKGAGGVVGDIKNIGKQIKESLKLDDATITAQVKAISQTLKDLGQQVTSENFRIDDQGITGFSIRVRDLSGDVAVARQQIKQLADQMTALKEFSTANVREGTQNYTLKDGTERVYTTFSVTAKRAMDEVQRATAQATQSMQQKVISFVQAASAGFTKVAVVARPIINVVTAIGRAYVAVIQHVLRFGQALARIPVHIAQSLANAFKNLANNILRIPGNALSSIGRSLGQIGTIIAGLVGYSGLKAVGRQFADVIKNAGPIEAIRIQFVNFMQQARANTDGFNLSADQMVTKMQEITGGAVKVTDMMEKSNLAFLLIGDTVGQYLPRLLAIAQASALSTGRDINEMFYSLAQGIGRLSTRWIDNLGISINATEEYKRYAAEVGKSASAITLAEKKQILLNATLREGERILERVGDVSLLLSTRVDALKSTFVNTRDAITTAFAPIFTVILGELNSFFAESGKRASEWSVGFVDAFAQLPSAVEREMAKLASLNIPMEHIPGQVRDTVRNGAEQMGYEAGKWAINAATWGANVGSQFIAGIIRGFASLISTAMNFISSVLSFWFSPGSPPRVAPQIDKWGEDMMGEWVDGMLSYPISSGIDQIKSELSDLLGRDVRDELFQYGVDSIASWARGLSIADMGFLIKSVDTALLKAKALNDELTKSYKKQSTELFKMQVLNKDPGSIRASLARVKTTRKAIDANQTEIDLLEMRKSLLQDQLDLMRMLQQAVEKAKGSSGKGAGGAAGGALDELGDVFTDLPLLGSGGLADKLSGIKETLEGIFAEPLKTIKDAFKDARIEVGKSWDALVEQFAKSKPKLYKTFKDIEEWVTTAWTNIKKFVSDFASGFTGQDEGLGTFAETMGVDVRQALEDAADGIGKALDYIKENKDGWIESAKGLFEGIGEGVGAFITSASPDVIEVAGHLKDLAAEIVNFIGATKDIGGAAGRFKQFGTILGKAAGLLVKPIGLMAQGLTALVSAMDNFMTAADRWREGDYLGAIGSGFSGMQDLGDIYSAPLKGVANEVEKKMANSFSPAGVGITLGIKLGEMFSGAIVDMRSRVSPEAEREALEIGKSINAGAAQGIYDTSGDVTDAINRSMLDVIMEAKDTLGSRSPSKEFNKIGQDSIAGYIVGWISRLPQLIIAITSVMVTTLAVVKSYVDPMVLAGTDLAKGMALGITNGKNHITEAARGAARAAIDAVNTEMGNMSPSKKGEWSGRMLSLGVAAGISGSARYPVNAAGAMANAALGALGGGAGGARSSQVNFNGPIVENLVVPNMAVGRQMSMQVAQDISDKIQVRRSPA